MDFESTNLSFYCDTKSLNIKWGEFSEMSSKTNTSIESKRKEEVKEQHREYKRIIRSNSRNRIFLLFLDSVAIIILGYLFGHFIRTTTNFVSQIIFVLFFLMLVYLPFAYFFRCGMQIVTEIYLNNSIYAVRSDIANLYKKDDEKTHIRYLQMDINRVHTILKQYIELSEIISPPIYNFELDRLQKRIDVFFNCVSEVIFPIQYVFSRAQKIQAYYDKSFYESQEHPTKEEMEHQFEEMQKSETGDIYYFDNPALDEFMYYLADTIFKPTRKYSPFSYRHPINLILFSKFFESWNSELSTCSNCKSNYQRAETDIEKYYKEIGRTKSQRKERMRSLTDSVIIVIVSVGISSVVGYLIQLAMGS